MVARELERIGVDVAALQETRFEGSGSIKERSYTIFWSGVKEGERRHAGVAFAIKNEMVSNLKNTPKSISKRIISMSISLKDDKCATLICAYAPTMVHTEQEKEEFYRCLSEEIRRIPVTNKLVLMGDFNARVGKDHEMFGPSLGKFGKGNLNSNGELLINFCTQHNLIITNTYFKQPDKNFFTWKHPRSKQYHLLDYVITKFEDKKDILNTKVMRSAECSTDHLFVRSSFRFQIMRRRRRTAPQPPRKLKVKLFRDPDIRSRMQEEVSRRLEEMEEGENFEEQWKNLRNVLLETSVEVIGYAKRKNEDWFEDNQEGIEDVLREKWKKHQEFLTKGTTRSLSNFKSAKAMAQRRSRELKNKWWVEKAEDLQRMAACNDTKGFYNGLKEIYGPRTSAIAPMKNKEETTLITDKDEIIQRWKEHFQDLLNVQGGNDQTVLNRLIPSPTMGELDTEITMEELEKALKSMSAEKATGLDGLPAEVYKHSGQEVKEKLLELIKECWRMEKVPQEFKDALIVTIYKKGDKWLCGNYRGISLLCTAGKIFTKILLNRLKILAENILPESQCGFRSDRSTNDMIFSLRQIQEKAIEQKKDLYMVFFDFKKAFDMVSREMLWRVLEILGCPPKFVKIVKDFHENMMGRVSISGSVSDPFVIGNGVKQGDPAAPTFFTLFLTAILMVMSQDLEEGVYIRTRSDGKLFNLARLKARTKTREILIRELLYADDAAMVSHSLKGIQAITSRFASISKLFGLEINVTKTELVFQPYDRNNVGQDLPIVNIDGTPLKTVSKFKYLGSHITRENKVDSEISHRIQTASASFGKLKKRLWDNHNITLTTKFKVFNAVVLTALLYSVETMTLHRRHIRKLTTFQTRHLRQLLKIDWSEKIPNVEVLRRAGMVSVEAMITTAQLRWTGHIVRMNDNRLPKQLLYGELREGSRNVGGQKLRYKDVIKRHLKRVDCDVNTWEVTARDRKTWRGVVSSVSEKVERRREEEYNLKSRSRHGLIQSDIICGRCGRNFVSNAGISSHLRSNKC